MKNVVSTSEAPQSSGLLSQAIIANGFIFVAGQIHMTPEGKIIEGSVEERLAQVMKNLSVILTAAGADFNDVVKVTVYLTDMSELKKLNEVYPTYFQEPFPAREAVCVKELPLGASLEISLIAALP